MSTEEKARTGSEEADRRSKESSTEEKRDRSKDSSNHARELPKFAVIGGSQAYQFLEGSAEKERIGEQETPFGESQPVFLFTGASGSFLFLSRHGELGYSIAAPFVNYRANIFALKNLGVKRIVSWSGPGAISTAYKIGQLVIVDDVIDETRSRAYTFYENKGLGFIRQNPVFCPHMRKLLKEALSRLDLDFTVGGTYVCTEGPRLETPAEIRKFSVFGADLVGMTLIPEVFLARELEMCYSALCYVTNYAEGVKQAEFQPGVLFDGLASEEEQFAASMTVGRFPAIIEALARLVHEEFAEGKQSECKCAQTMQRYRDRGDVGDYWHDWIRK